jgi:transposase
MPTEQTPGKPTTRRYTREEKAAAVRMVRSLRAELGTDQGTVHRVATQLGYGVELPRVSRSRLLGFLGCYWRNPVCVQHFLGCLVPESGM